MSKRRKSGCVAVLLGATTVMPSFTKDSADRAVGASRERVARLWDGNGGCFGGRNLVIVHEIGGREDEDLAHQVRVLLVAAHEADHPLARGVFDDLRESLAHDLLELHALLDHRLAAAAREQRLLDAREASS